MTVILAYLAVCYAIGFVILFQVQRRRHQLSHPDSRVVRREHHGAEPVAQ